MTQILIADDHEVVRRGIRGLLEGHEGWQICGEAGTGREAVAKALELQPDVVILDIAMPEMNGLEAARRIRRVAATSSILVLTVHEVDDLARDLVEAGVRGYLLKSDAGRMLVDAVAALVDKRTFFSSRVQAVTAEGEEYGRRHGRPPGVHLTGREREVLQLLAEGRSNKEVGIALRITTKTAETHRARLMAKLDVHSVAQLVRYAIRNQIVDA